MTDRRQTITHTHTHTHTHTNTHIKTNTGSTHRHERRGHYDLQHYYRNYSSAHNIQLQDIGYRYGLQIQDIVCTTTTTSLILLYKVLPTTGKRVRCRFLPALYGQQPQHREQWLHHLFKHPRNNKKVTKNTLDQCAPVCAHPACAEVHVCSVRACHVCVCVRATVFTLLSKQSTPQEGTC